MIVGGKRTRRRGLQLLAGLALGLGIVGAIVTLAIVGERGQAVLPIFVLGGFAVSWALLMASAIPRAATLTVAGAELLASWRPQPWRVAEVRFGRWVMSGIGTSIGVVMHVRGPDGTVIIGGRDHEGAGYPLDGASVRSVDFEVAAADLDPLAAALGVARGVIPAEPILELVRHGGVALRTMLPWFATIAVAGGFGALLELSGLHERLLGQPWGMYVIGGGTFAIVLGGLALTIRQSLKVRGPALTLQPTEHALVLARPGGAELERGPWAEVRATPMRYQISGRGGSFRFPVIELVIGDQQFRVAAWTDDPAWPKGVQRSWRSPRYLLGAAHWARLVDVLRRRHKL